MHAASAEVGDAQEVEAPRTRSIPIPARTLESDQPGLLGVHGQFRFFNSPGRLLRTARGYVLRVPANQLLADVWAFYAPDLAAATAEEAAAA